ncbi:MAG TPA: hypothetical protein VL337_08235 [Acidimicrobiales bacterium]|jgi:hypothetical protein|nr:hypothetical protein [Acidimicrobiales bacterium]
MSIENVAGELRSLRARLEAQRANTHYWPTKEEEHAADLDRYDRRMIKAAAMLGVEPPPVRRGAEFLFTDEDRRLLESRLIAAGLDVLASAEESQS